MPSDLVIPGENSDIQPSTKQKLMDQLEANINNIPKFLPDEALSWTDSTTASVDHENCSITKTTTRTWKMPGNERVTWIKEDKRTVEMLPQNSQEME